MSNDFDWVTARSNCSLAEIFERLKAEISADVKKKNELDGENKFAHYIISLSAGRIAVAFAEGSLPIESIVFGVTNTAIEVKDDNNQILMTATPTLSDDGICRLKVGEVECELWQFRKRALEGLFFKR